MLFGREKTSGKVTQPRPEPAMLEFAETLFPSLLRGLLWALRGLWWFAWDFCVYSIGWWIGWPVWRTLSFGRFPAEGFNGQNDASFFHDVLVTAVGMAVLAGVIWIVAVRVG